MYSKYVLLLVICPAFISAVTEDWHRSKEFNDRVKAFHDEHARQPSGKNLDHAKQVLDEYKALIREKLNAQGIFINSKYEYRGSTYEGVKVAKSSTDDDLEFDVIFVIEGGGELLEEDIQPDGYANLKPKPGKESRPIFQQTMEGGYVSAAKVRSKFYGQLEKALADRKECKIHYHGPAVKITVNRDGRVYISIDLAPHFDLSGGKGGERVMYVPRAYNDDQKSTRWLRSYSLKEKEMFGGMDRDNTCRKMVLRITKVLRKRNAELSSLDSNQLKTALFRVIDVEPNWKQDQLGARLIDVLKRLEDDLAAQHMEDYFYPGVNILKKMNSSAMQNMRDRLKKFLTDKELMKLLLFVRGHDEL